MIKFSDIISMAGVKLYDYKIHCATGRNWPPLEAFFDGQFKQWQHWELKNQLQQIENQQRQTPQLRTNNFGQIIDNIGRTLP